MPDSDARPVIILGAGGHARVLIDALGLMGVRILGATDAAPDKADLKEAGVKILGGDEAIRRYPPQDVRLVNGLGTVNVTPLRRELFDRFKQSGYEFASVIHPSAVIASDVRLGEGVQVMAGAVIQTGSAVGSNSIVNTRASVDHDCRIGAHVHLAPGVVLSGGVRVGDSSHLGTGAVVVQGVRIGEHAFIKANTLVKEDS